MSDRLRPKRTNLAGVAPITDPADQRRLRLPYFVIVSGFTALLDLTKSYPGMG
jgi:hypothetical protein